MSTITFAMNYFLSEVESADVNWLEMNNLSAASTGTKYVAAVYWAAMTSTTIGYGDIIMSTTLERIYSTSAMIIGASTYAFVTSRLVGMIIYGNRFRNRYSDIRSELICLMRDIDLPRVYRAIAGDFLFHWYHTRQKYDSRELLQVMSPQLRGIIAQHMHGEWIRSVSFLRGANSFNDLASAVAMAMEQQMYMPGEYVIKHKDKCDAFYVVDQGQLIRAGSSGRTILKRYDYFGEEMLLTSPGKAGYAVMNGTRYSTLYVLSRTAFFQLLLQFPELNKNFRKARMKIVFRRRVKSVLKKLIKWRRVQEDTMSVTSRLSEDCQGGTSMSISSQVVTASLNMALTTDGSMNALLDNQIPTTSTLKTPPPDHSVLSEIMSEPGCDDDISGLRNEISALVDVLSKVSSHVATLQRRLDIMGASNSLSILQMNNSRSLHSRSPFHSAIASGIGVVSSRNKTYQSYS